MTRAKSVLAGALSLVLALGALPVEAAEFARGLVVPLSAPAPFPTILAPLAASTLSISPATSAPVPALALPSAAPLAASPAFAAAPALALPAALPIANAGPAPVSAAVVLRAMAAPELAPVSGRIFDGTFGASAASGAEPVLPDAAGPAAAPRLDPPSSAPKAKRTRTTAGRLLRAAAAGVGASALAPLLWSAVPTAGALMLFAVAVSPVAAAAALLLSARIVRAGYRRLSRSAPARAGAPPVRRVVNTIRALGFALGIALTVATAVNQAPIIEGVHSYMDSRLPAGEREFKTEIPGKFFGEETVRVLSGTAEGRAALDRVRGRDGAVRLPVFTVVEMRQKAVALPGSFFADSTVAALSRTAEGREVLDGLRDRGGVVRMPMFFVSYQVGSAAQYTPPDVVFLSVETIEDGGVTVDQFLRDPKAQLDYLQREQAVIAHELTHADQARRSPFNADTWVLLKTNGSRLVSAVEAYASGRPADVQSPSADDAVRKDSTATAAPAQTAAAPVVIDAAEIHRAGFTVERFLKDSQAQKDYIAAHQAELARALKPLPAAPAAAAAVPPSSLSMLKTEPAPSASGHAAPRAPFSVKFGMIQEWEYEAYIAEHYYTHERLAADPGIAMSNDELWGYARGLQDFDAFLRSIDEPGIYAANFHGRSAHYVRYLAEQRAGWDAHRVEGYVLLARRDLADKNIDGARAHLEKARGIAAEKGLPAPVLVIPAR